MLPAIAAIMPYIQAGSAIVGLGQALGLWGRPKPPPTLSYDEALRRAQDVLNPLYSQQIERALENVDRSSLARGFFGQAPAAALRRSTAAQLEADRASQVAALANQMVGQSEQNALQQQQLAAQYALGKFDRLNQAAQTARNLWRDVADVTTFLPNFPWEEPQMTAKGKQVLALQELNRLIQSGNLGSLLSNMNQGTESNRFQLQAPMLRERWTTGL